MRIVFMGTPAPAAASLARLIDDGHDVAAVYTQPDRPSGRGKRISFSPVKELAVAREIPVLQPAKLRSEETIAEFEGHRADIAVVVAYGRILPPAMLSAFPYGAINVHFSLLPKYRGAAPVNWAIVNGENVTGVTTMVMDEGLDTGDVLLQREFRIKPDTTAVELMDSLAVLGAQLLSETLSEIKSITPKPQDHSLATFAPIMTREDGLIDWESSSWDIANRVRGFQPFPTAHTTFRGSRLTIWKAESNSADPDAVGSPGAIIGLSGSHVLVRCGESTTLRIDELQAEGKRRVQARDFINGMRPLVGEVLG